MSIAFNDDENGYQLQQVLTDDCGNVYEESDVSEPFVVLLDPANDPHARAAMTAYAESCQASDPGLASALRHYVR